MLAIHKRKKSFSDRWIKYCIKNNINYKIVNCYDSDIIEQLKGCKGLLWHWSHTDYRAQNFARQLIFSLEKIGIKVFPNFNSAWHFDDKVGQKYLLEAIEAPLVKSYVFYDKVKAKKWIKRTKFPKVFKLKGGAGSSNVKLIKSKKQAKKIVNRAFSKGFPLVSKSSYFKQRKWLFKKDKNLKSLIHLFKGVIKYVYPSNNLYLLPKQKGYIYFQDYVADNNFDDRIVVVGDKAFGLRRYVRENDFKASGSGIFEYNPELFDKQAISISFNISRKLNTQSLAYDFIYSKSGNPLITEISYAYAMGSAYDNCPGYWDQQLNWHNKPVNPQKFIIEDFIKSV